MRRAPLALAALGCALVAAPAANAAATKDFNFQSKGTAVQQGVVAGSGAPGTYEDFSFTIKPSEKNGVATVSVFWDNPADDWDLYVYQKVGGTLQTVGSATDSVPDTEEVAAVQAQGIPLPAGQYVIRVQNYAATVPNFHGTVKFTKYVPANKVPNARLKAPKRTRAGKRFTLDARKSKDPDGKIVSYAFDLDGNGSMETKTGKRGKIRRRFKKAGRRHVTVRVTDNKGARAYSTRTILVYPRK